VTVCARAVALCLLLAAAGCSNFPEPPASGAADAGADLSGDGDVLVRPDDGGLLLPDAVVPSDAEIGPDAPEAEPECRRDDDCNNGVWCDGVDFCNQRGECMVTPIPTPDDGNPCTDDSCAECLDDDADCIRGRHGRVIGTPTDRCACVLDADCPAGECAVARCIEGACEVRPADNGSVCALSCERGPASGTCVAGQCSLPPEGPVQSPLCSNGIDDDCDGVMDGGLGCTPASELTATARGAGTVGQGNGAQVDVTVWSTGQRMPAQAENLYCTARRIQHRQHFDTREALGLDPLTTAVDPGSTNEEVRSGVDGYEGRQGLRVCEGEGAIIGPLQILDSEHGLRVSLDVGVPNSGQRRPPPEHRLLLSYTTDGTRGPGGQTWLPLGVWGRAQLEPRIIHTDFLIDPPPQATLAWVRIESWAMDAHDGNTDCFWVDEFVASTARRAPSDAPRHRPTWNAMGQTAPARQTFDGVDVNYISRWMRITIGEHSFGVFDSSAMGGSHGLYWAHSGVTWAAIAPPPFVAAPVVYDRSLPMVVEYAADMQDASSAQPPSVGLGMATPTHPLGRLSGVPSSSPIDWFTGTRELDGEQRLASYHRVILPQSAKALTDVEIFFEMELVEAGGAALDEIDVFFHGASGEDVRVFKLPAQERALYSFSVEGTLPGVYQVQCHWQVAMNSDYATLSSNLVDVVLE
jgi:hypothetical protein